MRTKKETPLFNLNGITVKELMEYLKNQDGDTKIWVPNHQEFQMFTTAKTVWLTSSESQTINGQKPETSLPELIIIH